jgi:hypothetical protein
MRFDFLRWYLGLFFYKHIPRLSLNTLFTLVDRKPVITTEFDFNEIFFLSLKSDRNESIQLLEFNAKRRVKLPLSKIILPLGTTVKIIIGNASSYSIKKKMLNVRIFSCACLINARYDVHVNLKEFICSWMQRQHNYYLLIFCLPLNLSRELCNWWWVKISALN